MFLYFLPENNWPTGLTRHETKPAEKERNAVLTRSVSAASTSSVSLPFPSVSNGLPMGLCDVLFGIEKKKVNKRGVSPDVVGTVVDSTSKVAE